MDRRGQSSHKLGCLLFHLQVAVTSLNPGPSTHPPHPTAPPARPCPPPFSPGPRATQTQTETAWRTAVPKQTGGPLEVPPTSRSRTSPMPGVEKMLKTSLLDSGIYKCRNCGLKAGAACIWQSAQMLSGSVLGEVGVEKKGHPSKAGNLLCVLGRLFASLIRGSVFCCTTLFSVNPPSPSPRRAESEGDAQRGL